jgi:hypothetical protein
MSETPATEPTESDPNADSADGLAGGMGVSSERPGPLRGKTGPDGGATYGSAPTHTDAEPERNEDGEAVVDERYPAPQEDPNPFDTDRNPRHGT